MPKVPLSTITSGYGTVDALNQNFDAIEAAFDNTLSRDGNTPNQMQANLDMNGYEVLNVGSLNGVPVADLSDISGYVDTALAAATSASASATNAANTYDLFDDRYLGSKTSNPTVDNDGNALQVGAEYWNSVSNERRTWTGSAWVSSITVVPDASVTTAKLADGAVTTAKWAATNGQLAGMRNKIINGKMDISQRGTSFTPVFSTSYTLDRYRWVNDTVAQVTITQQADAPSTNEFSKSLRVQVTTSGAAPFNSSAHITQCVEGFNARDLIGRTFTLSFWVRSSKTGVHCVTFTNGPTIFSIDRTFITEYTINAANTWEYKTVTVSNGLITSGSFWNWENGTGLQVRWILGCGPTLHGSPNAWLTGEKIATANQVNCLDTVGNIFAITGVQLEPGANATPFEHRPIGAELALCQRYYYREQSTSVAHLFGESAYATSATLGNALGHFPVTMRTAPTALEQSGTASQYSIQTGGVNRACSAVVQFANATTNSWRVTTTVASGQTGGQAGLLYGNSTSAYLGWSAEL